MMIMMTYPLHWKTTTATEMAMIDDVCSQAKEIFDSLLLNKLLVHTGS